MNPSQTRAPSAIPAPSEWAATMVVNWRSTPRRDQGANEAPNEGGRSHPAAAHGLLRHTHQRPPCLAEERTIPEESEEKLHKCGYNHSKITQATSPPLGFPARLAWAHDDALQDGQESVHFHRTNRGMTRNPFTASLQTCVSRTHPHREEPVDPRRLYAQPFHWP